MGITGCFMRFIPHLVWLVGVVVLVVAFGRYSAASLPYQDPTPELLAVQRGHIEDAKRMGLTGGVVFLSGVGWVILRRRSRAMDGA
jgi:ABC-type arginine transport system permease subunit